MPKNLPVWQEAMDRKLADGVNEAALMEKYDKFVKAVLRKFVGSKPFETLTAEEEHEMKDFIQKNWPKFAKTHLKLETSGTGGVAGYMLPMGMKGPGKDPSSFVTQNQDYKILQPNAKRTKVYETEKLDESDSGYPEKCPKCGKNTVRPAGKHFPDGTQLFRCMNCNFSDRVDPRLKLKESTYFNSSISPEQKVEIALNEIRSAMIQTERLIRHTMKLKQESNEGSSLYSEKTRRSLKRISERAIRLMSMLETLK